MTPNVQKALRTWRSLVSLLPYLTEDEVLEALDAETSGRNRKSVVQRIVKRATRLSELTASALYQEYLNAHHQNPVPPHQAG